MVMAIISGFRPLSWRSSEACFSFSFILHRLKRKQSFLKEIPPSLPLSSPQLTLPWFSTQTQLRPWAALLSTLQVLLDYSGLFYSKETSHKPSTAICSSLLHMLVPSWLLYSLNSYTRGQWPSYRKKRETRSQLTRKRLWWETSDFLPSHNGYNRIIKTYR